MKNICIGPAFPLRGGIANFNEALCSSFIKKGRSSGIVSFYYQYPKFLFPGKTQLAEGPAPQGIEIMPEISSINPFSWFRAANKIKKLNPDFVIVHFWMPFMAPSLGTIIWRIKKGTNIKVIAITHNVIPHEKRPFDRLLTGYFIRKCDGFVTLAKSVLKDLETFTANQHKTFIPHPIYDIFGTKVSRTDALNYLKLDPKEKYLLFFGVIRKYKGLDLLLKAMAIPKIKELNLKLIVAGEFYESREPYDKLISENNLQQNIIICDKFIASDEVKYYFAAADMIVQTYHSATQSGVTQIAYHFERPMLVTNVGGLAEIVPHNKAGYVTETTPESIANAIHDFYKNHRYAEFEAFVKMEKEKFSWDTMIAGVETLVKKIKS